MSLVDIKNFQKQCPDPHRFRQWYRRGGIGITALC